MGPTDRLYYTDAYLTDFDARVLRQEVGDRPRLYLDRTAFYPTSGGQPHDRGAIAGVPVVDVVDEGEEIAHVLAAPLSMEDGGAVTGSIDWARRFDHMQQHTGQHVLSAVFADTLGFRTVSVHFGQEYSTLDLDTGSVDAATIVRAEERANEIVFANLPVTIGFEDAATATGLRKQTDREGTIRVVTIAGIDRSACGGTHVRQTGEIGPILLRRQDRVRGSARIEFVCGKRAIRRARADFDALASIAGSLSSAIDDAAARVTATVEQLRESERARRRLAEELSSHRARAHYETVEPDADGVRRIIREVATADFDDARILAHRFTELPKALLLVTTRDTPTRVLLATSEDSGIDAGSVLKALLAEVGGRGGGSARLAQGTAPDPAAVDRIRASVAISPAASPH